MPAQPNAFFKRIEHHKAFAAMNLFAYNFCRFTVNAAPLRRWNRSSPVGGDMVGLLH